MTRRNFIKKLKDFFTIKDSIIVIVIGYDINDINNTPWICLEHKFSNFDEAARFAFEHGATEIHIYNKLQ